MVFDWAQLLMDQSSSRSAVSRPVRAGRSSGVGRRLQQLALEFQRPQLSEARMRSYFVEVASEVLDDHFGIDPALEPLHAQALVTEFSVERFIQPVLPGFSRVDVRSVNLGFGEPFQRCPGDKCGAVVRA